MIGHFQYKEVAGTLLLPGISYTVAGLMAPGSSVLSAVPAIVRLSDRLWRPPVHRFPRPRIPFGDTIALRGGYFGAWLHLYWVQPFPWRVRTGPESEARAVVKLDGSVYRLAAAVCSPGSGR